MRLHIIIFSFLCLFIVGPVSAQEVIEFDHSHKIFDLVLKNHTKVSQNQTLFNYKKLKSNFPFICIVNNLPSDEKFLFKVIIFSFI